MKRSPLSAKALVLLAALALPATVSAQPASMPVQGYLEAAGGVAVSATGLDVTFRLFTASTGGTLVHEEPTTTDVVDGRFVYYLGSSTALDLAPFNGQPLWLEVEVGTELMTPRTPLGTTPYAAFAGGVQWNRIVGVPSTIADGDSDTTYTFSSPLLLDVGTSQVSLSTSGCDPGEGWIWDGTNWVCEPTAGTPYTAGSGGVTIDSLTRVVSVQAATCVSGQYSWWTGAAWACANDATGIAAIVPGAGIGVLDNQVSIASANCGEFQYSQFRGGAWRCVDDVSSATEAGPGLRYNVDGELEIASDDCTLGQQTRWSGTAWICETDAGIRTVSRVGEGLSVVSNATSATVAIVSDVCAAGEYLTWTSSGFDCVADASSAYTGTTASGIDVTDTLIGIDSPVCGAGQYSRWTATGWDCINDAGISVLLPGSGIGINVNTISIAAETCDDANEYSRWNGSAWVCVTDVSAEPDAGPGIDVTSNVVSINSPNCVDGQYSRWNNTDGVWVCETDDVGLSSVAAGSGVLVAGDGRTVAVDADVCPGGYSAFRGGRFVCVADATPSYTEGQGVQFTGTTIAVRADDCPAGVSRFNTTTNRFECATDQQGVTSVSPGAGISVSGTTTPTVSLRSDLCDPDEAWVWGGSAWECVSPVLAGNGLSRAGRTLSVDLSAACPANQFLRWTGSGFQCAAITFPGATVSVNAPLLGTGSAGDPIRLDVGTCSEGETWMRRGGVWTCEPAVTATATNGIERSATGDLSLSTSNCVDGEVWRRIAGAWQCTQPVNQNGAADANRPINASTTGTVEMSNSGCGTNTNEAWVWNGSWSCEPTVVQGSNISVSGRTVSLNLPAGCSAGQAARWNGSGWDCETIAMRAAGGCSAPSGRSETREITFDVFMQNNEGANGLWFYTGGPFNSNTAYLANEGTSPAVFGTGAVDVEQVWDRCANCGGQRNYSRPYTVNAGQTYRVCAFESFGDGWNGGSSYMRLRYNDGFSSAGIVTWNDISNIGTFTANGCGFGGASRETCWYRCELFTPEFTSGNGTGNCAAPNATQRVVHGHIDGSGNIISGQGFAVYRRTTGVYEIQFSPIFGSNPSVVVSQVYINDHNTGGSRLDNALLTGISNNRATVVTGDGAGNPDNRNFSFIAVGTN